MKKLIEKLDKWNSNISERDKQLKYKKMSQSEYIFFRGTNHLFWDFIKEKQKIIDSFIDFDTYTWIQGDLHAYNYGIFLNDKQQIVYDLNDFDESCITHYLYDLIRMSASIVLIARENGFKPKEYNIFQTSFTKSYIKTLKKYNDTGKLPETVTTKNAYGKLDELMQQIKNTNSRKKQIKNLTEKENGSRIFDYSHPKLADIHKQEKNTVINAINEYARNKYNEKKFETNYFDVLDVAKRISTGTGSFGLPRYYVLIKGNSKNANDEKQVVLDVKYQVKPTAYIFVEEPEIYPVFANEAIRHQIAYKALLKDVDDHLGVAIINNKAFSVRERSPYKAYFPTQILDTPTRFRKLAEQWGYILATAHLRSLNLFNSKKVENLDSEDYLSDTIKSLAVEYADINTNYFRKFTDYLFLNE